MVGLYATWYKDYPQGSFRFNDVDEWKGMDKSIPLTVLCPKASTELYDGQVFLERKEEYGMVDFGVGYQTVISVRWI
jgi:hypothetical protein